jgi:hypothetical protein
VSGAGTHAGVPISFADNVVLEELSLVIDADKSENKSAYRFGNLFDALVLLRAICSPAQRSTGIARALPTDPRIGRDAMTVIVISLDVLRPTDPRIGRDAMTEMTQEAAHGGPTDPRIGRDAMTQDQDKK